MIVADLHARDNAMRCNVLQTGKSVRRACAELLQLPPLAMLPQCPSLIHHLVKDNSIHTDTKPLISNASPLPPSLNRR